MTAVAIEERVLQLAIAKVLPSPQNPRGAVGDVAELAESIKTQGIVEPLIVTQIHVQPDEAYRLVAGHRRLAAARLAGLKTVPCLVRQLGEREQLMTMLVENLQRQDLAPLAEARGYQQLAALEYSQREIARQVGKSQSHIAKRLALLKLSAPALEKFESGGITAEDAVTLAAAPPAIQAEVVAHHDPYGSMANRIRMAEWAIEEAKRPKPKGPTPAQRAADEAKWKSQAERQRAKQRAEEKLRAEARAARMKVMPKVLSRGERELQHAATIIVHASSVDETRIAAELLGLKAPKPKHGYPDFRGVLAKRAAVSKVKAIEVLLALALGIGESHVRSQWAGPSSATAGHLGLLKKAGYKPNAIDRKLLKARR